MTRPELMAIVVALLVLFLVLMVLGWRARKKRQSPVATPKAVPALLGAELGRFSGKYVATTTAGDPLDRVAVHGLGFRGGVSVLVTDSGLLMQIDGTGDKWIPATDLRSRRSATWTIDRVVEQGGLELLEWQLGDRAVDSYFRFDDALDFEFAVDTLLAKKES